MTKIVTCSSCKGQGFLHAQSSDPCPFCDGRGGHSVCANCGEPEDDDATECPGCGEPYKEEERL